MEAQHGGTAWRSMPTVAASIGNILGAPAVGAIKAELRDPEEVRSVSRLGRHELIKPLPMA